MVLWTQWAVAPPGGTLEDFVYDLFSNNHTPAYTDSAADYTIASFTGYAQVAVARSTFAAATATGGIGTIVSSVAPQWTCSGGSAQTCYGWIMRGATSGKLLGVGQFATPRLLTAGTTENIGYATVETGQF
jgi:hypothetical protein